MNLSGVYILMCPNIGLRFHERSLDKLEVQSDLLYSMDTPTRTKISVGFFS